MRNAAWLLIAVFCAGFIQVQPVEQAQCTRCMHCHCRAPGDCGMPCNSAPTPAPVMFAAGQPARVSQPALRRNVLPARPSRNRFYASFVERTAPWAALDASAPMASPAAVPLFKAHCCFLI